MTDGDSEVEGGWTHLVRRGPWWDRCGCRCRVVTPADTPDFPASGFPWTAVADDEVVILVERDPVAPDLSAVDGWSCIIRAEDIAPI